MVFEKKKRTMNSSPPLSPFEFLYYSFFENERLRKWTGIVEKWEIENSFKVKITVFSPQGYDDIIATIISGKLTRKVRNFQC